MYTKPLVLAALFAGSQAKKTTNSTELEQIVGGILKGAIDAEGFTDITQCITDAEGVFGDAKTAIADFEKGGVSNVIDGVKEVGAMLKMIKAAMSDCSHLKADWAKLEKMAAIFESPTSFAYHVGKDLLINGKDIYKEIATAIGDYKSQKWEDFGINIGEAAAKTILGEEQRLKDMTKLEEIVSGVLKGALDAEGFTDINQCINDAEGVFADAKEAIADFEKKDIPDTINGIKKIADMLMIVKKGMSDCSHLKADWEKLEKMAAIFASPTTFAEHVGKDLIVNGKDIFKEITTAVHDYQTQDYSDFGFQVGEAAAKVILGAESQKQIQTINNLRTTKLELIVGGVLNGALNAEGFTDITQCIQDAEEVFADAKIAVDDFEQKDVSHIIDGIKEVGVMLGVIKKGMSDCSHLKADW